MKELIIVAGLAGSGKTTLSIQLAKALPAVLFDKDPLTRRFTEALLEANGLSPDDRESDFYLNEIRPLEYQTMEAVAAENFAVGHNIILSAPYLKELQDPAWYKAFSKRVVKPIIVWVKIDEETLYKRSIKRGASRDTWKLNNWKEYQQQMAVNLKCPHICFDNSGELTEEKVNSLINSIEKS